MKTQGRCFRLDINLPTRFLIHPLSQTRALSTSLQAYKSGLYGARYAWLIPGWYSNDWWTKHIEKESLECTGQQMNETAKSYISCDVVRMSPENIVTASGQVQKFFKLIVAVLVDLTCNEREL